MKVYEKPEIVIERYELSKHVANCYFEINNDDEYKCAGVADDGSGLSIFLTEGTCTQKVTTGSTFEDYCYMGSTDGLNTFQS